MIIRICDVDPAILPNHQIADAIEYGGRRWSSIPGVPRLACSGNGPHAIVGENPHPISLSPKQTTCRVENQTDRRMNTSECTGQPVPCHGGCPIANQSCDYAGRVNDANPIVSRIAIDNRPLGTSREIDRCVDLNPNRLGGAAVPAGHAGPNQRMNDVAGDVADTVVCGISDQEPAACVKHDPMRLVQARLGWWNTVPTEGPRTRTDKRLDDLA